MRFVDFASFFFVFASERKKIVKENTKEEEANNGISAREGVNDGFGKVDVEKKDDKGGGN